jgi:hypothetical protein
MRRIHQSVLAAALAAALAVPALAQQQPGQPGAQPGQPGQPAKAGQLPGSFRQPIYQFPDVQRSLKITEEQIRRLNQANDRLMNEFRTGYGKLGDLAEAQRAARTQELLRVYNTGAMRAAQDVLNEEQMNRYRQIHWQYQGAGAFLDEDLARKLKLADEQLQRLRQLNDTFDRKLEQIQRAPGANPEEIARRYTGLRRDQLEQLNKILNEQQQRMWREMTGDPYQFQYRPPPRPGGAGGTDREPGR